LDQENIIPVQEDPVVSLPVPRKIWGRILFGLYVTVLPAFAFLGVDALRPDWQDGRFESYMALFLQPEASLPFLLLLGYSVVCYLSLLAAPVYFSRSFVVRFGIYTGTLLALQYSIITLVLSFALLLYFIILIWIVPFVIIFLYRLALKKWARDKVNISLLVLALASILIGIFWSREDVFIFVFMGLIMASPFWSFLIALRAAIWLFRNHEIGFTLPHGLGAVAWLTGYVAAWRYDIQKMYELYAALPTQPPPDCYIATAAAHGHPQFVRSRIVERRDGISLRLNSQLQTLKFAELALMAVNPFAHKVLRRLYDVIGKSLARGIRNPFLADIAYLLLKPWERLARSILKRFIPEFDSITIAIYTD